MTKLTNTPSQVFTLKQLLTPLVLAWVLCGVIALYQTKWALLVGEGAFLGFIQWSWIALEARLSINKLQWMAALFRAALIGGAIVLLGVTQGTRWIEATGVVFAGFLGYKLALLGLIGYGLTRPKPRANDNHSNAAT